MAEDGKRKNLGRGLDSLLGSDVDAVAPGGPGEVAPIEALHPGANQPRQIFSDAEIGELAASIKRLGVLQPIIVRRDSNQPGRFEIIAGERRWRAAQVAQLHEVPIIVRELDDSQALEIALVENLQRENLSPLEEAEGYRRLIDEHAHTQDALGQMLGKSRSHVANTMRLLGLPDAVKDMVNAGELSAGHARAVLGATNPLQLAKRVVRRGLNVRQTEALVKRQDKKSAAGGGATKTAPQKNADTISLEKDLSVFLGLKVDIEFSDPGGRLTLNYNTLDQLDDILHRLTEGAHLGAGNADPQPEEFCGEDDLNAAAAEDISGLPEADGSDDILPSDNVDDAIAEMEKGAAWDEDEEIEFDAARDLKLNDDDLAQLIEEAGGEGDTPSADQSAKPDEQ
ncbi:MAG: ParB/RepB/Spo0J family partition protein [Rhodospirillales bacterium]|nr:ParB/RepB/Spo0J family partition protein [Rhodospirillales bacterium]